MLMFRQRLSTTSRPAGADVWCWQLSTCSGDNRSPLSDLTTAVKKCVRALVLQYVQCHQEMHHLSDTMCTEAAATVPLFSQRGTCSVSLDSLLLLDASFFSANSRLIKRPCRKPPWDTRTTTMEGLCFCCVAVNRSEETILLWEEADPQCGKRHWWDLRSTGNCWS